jgi:DHA2 family multidrug resistance protein-like MFS transporter
MAVLGSVLGAVYASRMMDLLPTGLPLASADAAAQTLGQATVLAEQLEGASGHAVLEAGRAAYVHAMHVTDLVAAAILVLGAVVDLTTLQRNVTRVLDPAEPRPRAASRPSG